MGTQYPLIWDLDAIYPGGSASAAFTAELAGMENDIQKLQEFIRSRDEGQGEKLRS